MIAERCLYAPPRQIRDLSECHFYHTIELPGYGCMPGSWDLRNGIDAYLGGVCFAGKRVLDVGTANGFLCFEMERRGAEVVGYDLSEKEDWDLVPFGGNVSDELMRGRQALIRKINNAWWFTRELLESRAQVVYGTVYNLPEAIGPFQVSVLGSVLLHLRDPFLALQRAAAITTETMVVSDLMFQRPKWHDKLLAFTPSRFARHLAADLAFVPNPEHQGACDTWWALTPALIAHWLRILGFSHARISYHTQKFVDGPQPLFTVVATRGK